MLGCRGHKGEGGRFIALEGVQHCPRPVPDCPLGLGPLQCLSPLLTARTSGDVGSLRHVKQDRRRPESKRWKLGPLDVLVGTVGIILSIQSECCVGLSEKAALTVTL